MQVLGYRLAAFLFGSFIATQAHAVSLIATGSLPAGGSDLSIATAGPLENGQPGNLFGGLGSGFAWAGGSTFLALPDRGPNAVTYNTAIDNTTTYIPRFHTLDLKLTSNAGGSLPFTLTPTLQQTTLFYSTTALTYGAGGTPGLNSSGKYYFTGRSDAFGPGNSLNANNGRFDPESIRVSSDGKSVFVSDEYGPYVYQFDRATGERIRTYSLPSAYAAEHLNAVGDTEISGNTSGRVANKGMEGLAITPDGKTLVGAMQSPLIQDGGTSAAYTRIITIDVQTGATKEFAYQLTNIGTVANPKYGTVSDIVALNEHEFLVDERDGKGLGDGSNAGFKTVQKIDIANATDVTGVTGAANLATAAVSKTLFVDAKQLLSQVLGGDAFVPAKLESLAFGQDVEVNGTLLHTLYVANDNDFLSSVLPKGSNIDVANPNQFFVFGFTDADLKGSLLVQQNISAVPEPSTYAIMLMGVCLVGGMSLRRSSGMPFAV